MKREDGKVFQRVEELKKGIYIIKSPSEKIYIGQSININKRFLKYKSLNCNGQVRLYNSFKKYGVNNHKFEIIEIIEDISKLNERERYWQEYYDCIGKNGLNCRLTKSNDKSGKFSEHSKLKISIKRKGMKFSEEHCKNIGLSKRGIIQKESTKLKISIANSGKQLSQEHKDNLKKSWNRNPSEKELKFRLKRKENSIKKKNEKDLELHKKKLFNGSSINHIILLNTETGIYYNSIREASITISINEKTLGHWINGTRKNKSNFIKV